MAAWPACHATMRDDGGRAAGLHLQQSQRRKRANFMTNTAAHQDTFGASATAGAASAPSAVAAEDSGGKHFLRFLGVYLAVSLLSVVVVGLVWFASMLSHTGRRKRDVLMLMIPVWGAIVTVQTIWRASAKSVYWAQREDRPSKTLF